RTVRRDVFDLIGPAARAAGAANADAPKATDDVRLDRGLALMGRTEILPLPCQPSPAFVTHLAYASMLANRQPLLKLMRAGDIGTKAMISLAGQVTPPPSQLYSFAVLRQVCGHDWGTAAASGPLYVDRPNVVTYRTRIVRRGDEFYI